MPREKKVDQYDEEFGSLSQESLSQRVMEAMTDQIISGRLLPGQRVDVGFYASKWEVSVTPVRDAARQLETLGFLKVLPRRGVFVTELGAKDVKEPNAQIPYIFLVQREFRAEGFKSRTASATKPRSS